MLRRADLLLVLLFALQAAAIEPPPDRGKWFAFRADNVHVFSNASPAATRELARDLVQMRHAIGQITKLDVRTPYTTRVFLFVDAKSLAPYLEAVIGQFLALFRSGYDNTIKLRADAQGAVDRSTYHSIAEYVVEHTISSPPRWVLDGLAEYCSTLAAKEGAGLHRPIPGHVATLGQKSLLPLRELFSVTPGSPLYDGSRRAGIFHAQSWALVHYLAGATEERRAQFSQFLQRTNAGEPAGSAFEASFGIPHAQLEKELRQHVQKLTTKSTGSVPDELKGMDSPDPEPMTRDAVLYELGRLVASMREDHAVHAVKFFENALELNPRHAGALASLGRLHQYAGRMQEAESAFARAIELGSDDPDVYLLLGRAIVDRYANTQPPQAEILKARSLFTKAAELRPDSALAWIGVGMTYVGSDDVAPGIAAMQRAQALDPREATAPRVLQALQEHQQRMAINAAIASAQAGKLIDALVTLDQTIPNITNEKLRQIARKLREDVAKLASRR
ncbi:MAG TPA: tetratricopeptide repeat protein [Thermoanaerobaculia bacterium]|nr:tetratricopeptide repeat protein [Thermoanaerobaculia bacterium]